MGRRVEREFIRERTREAIARLKAQGKTVGRPPKWSEAARRRIIDLVRRDLTLRETCQLVGIGYRTALRYLSSGVPQGADGGEAGRALAVGQLLVCFWCAAFVCFWSAFG